MSGGEWQDRSSWLGPCWWRYAGEPGTEDGPRLTVVRADTGWYFTATTEDNLTAHAWGFETAEAAREAADRAAASEDYDGPPATPHRPDPSDPWPDGVIPYPTCDADLDREGRGHADWCSRAGDPPEGSWEHATEYGHLDEDGAPKQ